jgi:hypothetical protein
MAAKRDARDALDAGHEERTDLGVVAIENDDDLTIVAPGHGPRGRDLPMANFVLNPEGSPTALGRATREFIAQSGGERIELDSLLQEMRAQFRPGAVFFSLEKPSNRLGH